MRDGGAMNTIRDMCEADCEDVEKLFRICFAVPWSKESIADMFRVDGYENHIAFSEETKTIVGYAGVKTVLGEGDITNVAVHPAHRRRGIAGKLLKALLNAEKKRGTRCIFLEVRALDKAAISLYEKAGFGRIALRKDYYTCPREEPIIVQRSL